MKRGVICLPVMAAIVALSGMGCSVPCSTLTDARAGKGTGCSRLYDRVSFETVWGSVRSALADVGLTIVSENREKGYILAYRDVTGFSWGENGSRLGDTCFGTGHGARLEETVKRIKYCQLYCAEDILWDDDVVCLACCAQDVSLLSFFSLRARLPLSHPQGSSYGRHPSLSRMQRILPWLSMPASPWTG
jgi:hypothetical protein